MTFMISLFTIYSKHLRLVNPIYTFQMIKGLKLCKIIKLWFASLCGFTVFFTVRIYKKRPQKLDECDVSVNLTFKIWPPKSIQYITESKMTVKKKQFKGIPS